MCYNIQASITSFIVGFISSIILFHYDAILSIFFMFVFLMQLYDFIFWSNQKKNNINFFFTKLAMITNYSQPILLGLLLFLNKRFERKYYNNILFIFILYIISTIVYIIYSWNNINYTLVSKKSYPSLYWQWTYLKYKEIYFTFYMFMTILLSYFGFPKPLNYILIFIILLSFIISYYFYKGKSAVGRFWCYYSAYLPLLFILYYLFK
jgi:hypothetical protein